jgi:hypothetical protein
MHGGEIRWLPEFTFASEASQPAAAPTAGPPAPHIEVGARRQVVGK